MEGRIFRIEGEDEFVLNAGHGAHRIGVENMIEKPLDTTGIFS